MNENEVREGLGEGSHNPAEAGEEGQPLCFNCLTVIEETDSFCRKCGAPVGSLSAVGPIERIHATGFMLRKATNPHIKGWMFWTGWTLGVLIYLPNLVLYLSLIPESMGAVVLVGGLSFALFGIVLVKLAVYRLRQKSLPEEEA